MNTETATKLVNPTFVDELCTQETMVAKEFAELKRVDFDKKNREKSQLKAELKERKEEYLVFNYLWRRFSKTMAIKGYEDPQVVREVIGELEFRKVARAAKKFYKFWAAVKSIPFVITIIVAFFLIITLDNSLGNIGVLFITFMFALCSFMLVALGFENFINPDILFREEKDRRNYLLNIWRNNKNKTDDG